MYSDDFEIDLEKSKFTASDVLEQQFDDDSDFSGSDSDGEEGEDVYMSTLIGPNFEHFYFERGDFGEHFFRNRMHFILLLARQTKAVLKPAFLLV